MFRAFQAELLKLRRRSVFIWTGVAALLFATLTTLVTFLSAESGPSVLGARGLSPTLQSLAEPSGATEAFSTGAGFLGIIMLAIFISNVGFEYARGTFGAALMKQPRRLRLLGGKVAALLVFLAGTLAVAELFGWLIGLAIAPTQDVSTSAWFSASALGDAASAYGVAFGVAGAWAVFGMTIAILARSVPVALGIGLAWAGPFEHLTQRAWSGASEWFPGLLLEGFAAGGTTEVTSGRALSMVLLYAGVAASAALIAFSRRDIAA